MEDKRDLRHAPRYYCGDSAYGALSHRFGLPGDAQAAAQFLPDLPEGRSLSNDCLKATLWFPDETTLVDHEAYPAVFMLRDEPWNDRDIFQVRAWLDAGFAVVMLNAIGHDQRFNETNRRRCETLAAEITAFAAYTVAFEPQLRSDAVMVDGWITAWIMSKSSPFCAGVQREALINPATAYGTCPAGELYVENRSHSSLKDKMEALAADSVLAGIDGFTLPILIACDASNAFYAREQSEQLYSAMKDRNPSVPCEMLVFGQHASSVEVQFAEAAKLIARWGVKRISYDEEAKRQ